MRALIYLALMYLAAYLSACGPMSAPPMAVDTECQLRGTTFQIEVGYAFGVPDHHAYCEAAVALMLAPVYDAYQAWRPVDMGGHVVRMRAAEDLRTTDPRIDVDFAVGGHTYSDAIDLGYNEWVTLAHEMNHVARGSGHGGWCVDFGPWVWETLHDDERSYLDCDNY